MRRELHSASLVVSKRLLCAERTARRGVQIDFELGEPFQPFNQLMGVLPAGSKHALPAPLRPLFDGEESPILDFYPNEFRIDMNGKRFAWQGVALLPFIEEDRLLDATGPIIAELPADERRRNERCALHNIYSTR